MNCATICGQTTDDGHDRRQTQLDADGISSSIVGTLVKIRFVSYGYNFDRLSRYGNFKVSKLRVFCLLCYVIKNCDFSHNELCAHYAMIASKYENLIVWKKFNTCSLNN